MVLLNESHDPAGAFAAYPASLKPPEPFRDPGPGCVDHLRHHTPVALSDSPRNQGTPSWLHDSTSSIRVSGVRATLIRWKPSKPTSRSHRSQRSSDTQQQVGPDTARGPLKIAGVEVRSSPGTSTSTRNPRSTPTHPHSTRKSPKTDASQRLFRTSIDRLRNHTPGFQEIRASLLDPIHSLALIQYVPQTKDA